MNDYNYYNPKKYIPNNYSDNYMDIYYELLYFYY